MKEKVEALEAEHAAEIQKMKAIAQASLDRVKQKELLHKQMAEFAESLLELTKDLEPDINEAIAVAEAMIQDTDKQIAEHEANVVAMRKQVRHHIVAV